MSRITITCQATLALLLAAGMSTAPLAHAEISAEESGEVYDGDEPAWNTFTLRDTSNASTLLGRLVTSYDTRALTLAAYTDFWAWTASAWPNTFKLDFEASGAAGVDTPPSSLPSPRPMMAFPVGLTEGAFGSSSTSGFQVWAISDTASPSSPLGFLLRDTTDGTLKWLITWDGYSERGHLLSALPGPGDDGGILLGDDADTLWFTRLTTPPATLINVIAAYDVHTYWP